MNCHTPLSSRRAGGATGVRCDMTEARRKRLQEHEIGMVLKSIRQKTNKHTSRHSLRQTEGHNATGFQVVTTKYKKLSGVFTDQG